MYPFLPTISAIHSVYTGFHSIGSSQQLDLNGLFPQLDHGTVWTEQAKDACQQIYGIVSHCAIARASSDLVTVSERIQASAALRLFDQAVRHNPASPGSSAK
jgi:triphosphoribosyl-dephospho-CoA synthetase